MIKIIKEGKKEFKATCPKCGCEFSYQLSDVIAGIVCCPCCDQSIYHPSQDDKSESLYWGKKYTQLPIINIPTEKDTISVDELNRFSATGKNSCEGCPVYARLQKGEVVVDDSCYWCSRSPSRITCTTVGGNVNA